MNGLTECGARELSIVVRYSRLAEEWLASLEDELAVVFGGEFPLAAMRRLLEGLAAEPGEYTMRWIQPGEVDLGYWRADWQPPKLLYRCPECDGKGQRGDPTESGPCGKCAGRGVLSC
jgi:hypothetical protein